MTTYVRLIPGTQTIERYGIELTADEYARLVANGKAKHLRLWVPVAAPTSATQVVHEVAPIIDATTATQTWALRDRTAQEVEALAISDERAKAQEILDDIQTQRAVTRATWDGYTAAQLRAEQWRDRQVMLRAARLYMREVKRAL